MAVVVACSKKNGLLVLALLSYLRCCTGTIDSKGLQRSIRGVDECVGSGHDVGNKLVGKAFHA